MQTTREIAGKNVLVMGLGHFGGGIGVTRWLVEQGANVTVTDKAAEEALTESKKLLDGLPIRYRLGGHDHADLVGCDLLVISPAVPKDRSEFVAEAVRRGIPISSEMNLFVERCPARRIVGITGSAGKSTTTAMLGAIADAAAAAGVFPRAWMGGNIGRSLLSELGAMSPEDVVVLELSSFQLEDLGALRWSPCRAVITNIRPNHLDRHGTMEAYTAAKLNLVRFQQPQDHVYVPALEAALILEIRRCGARGQIIPFSFPADFSDVVRVPGRHNRENAAAAIAVARGLGIDDAVIRQGLAGFHGLPHRLEFVAERRGVRYYNDSKSTTPESTVIALDAFDEPVILLVGGRHKGAPFDEMCTRLARAAKAVICYGESGPLLAHTTNTCLMASPRPMRVLSVGRVDEAVSRAAALAVPGDVVVLSPACTSYDQFSNYEERGEIFRQAVHGLPQG